MRQFKLWNYEKDTFADLNSKDNYATLPQGLGLNNDLAFSSTNDSEYLVNSKVSNKDIKFKTS